MSRFLEASEAAHLRAQRLRRRRLLAVVVALAGIAAAAVGTALYTNRLRGEAESALLEAERQGQLSTAAALAGRALREVERDGDVELAALAARQSFLLNHRAGGAEQDPLIEDALRTVLGYPDPSQILRGHESYVESVAIDSSGRMVAAGGRDASIRLWNLTDRERTPRTLLGHEERVRFLRFTPEGTLVSGAGDGVRLWTLGPEPGEPRRLEDGENRLQCFALSGDGRWLFAAPAFPVREKRATLHRWDLHRQPAEPISEHILNVRGGFRQLAASFDGSRVAAVSRDGLRIWEAERGWGELLHSKALRSVALSPAGDLAATATLLWQLGSTGDDPSPEPLPLASGRSPYALAFDRTGRWLAAGGSSDGEIRLWDTEAIDRKKLEEGEKVEPVAILRGHARHVFALDFRKGLLISGSGDRTVRLWDRDPPGLLHLPGREVKALAFEENVGGAGAEVALIAAERKAIRRWRLAAQPPEATTLAEARAAHPSAGIRTMALDPRGEGLLFVTSKSPQALVVRDLTEPSEPEKLPELEKHDLYAAAWAPGGGPVAWAGRGSRGIRVIQDVMDPESRIMTLSVEPKALKIKALAFNPPGWLVAAGEARDPDEGVLLYREGLRDGASGELLATAGYRGGWQTAAFNPRGDVLAVGGGGGIVLLWRFEEETTEVPEPEVIPAHTGYVYGVAFDREGRRLATAADDGTAKVWQLADLNADPTILETGDENRSVAFSPQGDRLAVGGKTHGIRFFSLRLDELAERLCDRVGRNLSPEEWSRLVGETIPYEPTCP